MKLVVTDLILRSVLVMNKRYKHLKVVIFLFLFIFLNYSCIDPKNDKLLKYKLYIKKDKKLAKIIIQEIYKDKIIKIHRYW